MPATKLTAALCLPVLGLAACMAQPPAQQAAASGFASDNTGKAALCTAPPVEVTDGKDSTATIATGGGGWCGVTVTRQGKPLGAGLLTQPPRNGSVYIHLVGDATRVDYTPRAGVAADSFAVKFIPGDEIMRVTVTGATAQVVK